MQYVYGPNHLGKPVVSWNGIINQAFIESDGVYIVVGYSVDLHNYNTVTLLYTGQAQDIETIDEIISLPIPDYIPACSDYTSIWTLNKSSLVEPLLTKLREEFNNPKPWYAPAGMQQLRGELISRK